MVYNRLDNATSSFDDGTESVKFYIIVFCCFQFAFVWVSFGFLCGLLVYIC